MQALKKERTPLRASATKMATTLREELKKEDANTMIINALLKKLETKSERLAMVDGKIMDILRETDAETAEFETEFDEAEVYRDRLQDIQAEVQQFLSKLNADAVSEYQSVTNEGSKSPSSKRKFKLPKIEWKKFGGEPKDWLGFWGQFAKIDDDEEMDPADKFQYLLQAVEQGSRAADLVQSFPPSGKCYPQAIESLKDRFGNEETLVEVYVRELLRLVLQNALNPKMKIVLSTLYDKLETQLRALATLGVTSEKYASMLYPLVESCLPEDVLRAWERNRNLGNGANNTDESAPTQNQLTLLMTFLRGEVKGEERISMARRGFAVEKEKKDKPKSTPAEDFPTAAGLFSGTESSKPGKKSKICYFCDMSNHPTQDCYKAKKMTLTDKKSILQKKGVCYSCFEPGHTSKFCKAKPQCVNCKWKHYMIMCPDLPAHKSEKKIENVKESTTKEQISDTSEKKISTLANQMCTSDVLLETLIVTLLNGTRKLTVRAILDSGSQRSYLTKSAAKAIGYPVVGTEAINHNLFGGVESGKKCHNIYQILVCSQDRNYTCTFAILDTPEICGNIPKVQNGPWISELRQKRIKLTDFEENNQKIDLLIGSDIYGKLLTGQVVQLPSGPVAIQTRLGWTLSGKVPRLNSNNDSTLLVTNLFVKDAEIQNLWKLDTIGITDPVEDKTRDELQEAAMEHFLQAVTTNEEGRYEIALPFIVGHNDLPSNKGLTEKRMQSSTRKLLAEGKMQPYQQAFKEWKDENIIEEIPPDAVEKFGHYLPHRAVYKEESTTKVRPVFDASAREKGFPSLNDCLEKGPNLLEMIPAVLTRFRMNKIGVLADIKKAYLQISVRPADRDFLRFLLYEKTEDFGTKGELHRFKEFRHRRVVFGVSASSFILGATINYHLDRAPPPLQETARKLKPSFYIDNCIASVSSEEDLNKFMNESKELMSSAMFDLRGWEWSDSNLKTERVVPVLGLTWDLGKDELSCDLRYFPFVMPNVTKRSILSAAHRVFDPIGFSAPVTLLPKLLLQETWGLKLGWDEPLPDNIGKKFVSWLKSLPMLAEVKIPRWLFQDTCEKEKMSLHVFVDASKYAYAACIFIRGETASGVSTQLVLAKTRVAPVKPTTIPRLELLACCIGARLADSVKKILHIDDVPISYWTDSSNALCWIKQEDKWGTFVSNRVKEIRSLSNKENWNHVPGSINPADLPSRGCSVSHLLQSAWWEGPDWLKEDVENWPKSQINPNADVINSEKMKTVASNLSTSQSKKFSETILNGKKSMHFERVLRVVAWMNRFWENCRRRKNKEPLKSGHLTVAELESAEITIVKIVQRESLKENPDYAKGLRIFEDEMGVQRVKTKIMRRDDLMTFRTPAVFSPSHTLVKLLVTSQHLKLSHAGIQVLLCTLREKFWIVRARRLIRTVILECMKCKRFDVKKSDSEPAPLPIDRVREAAVFEVTGVDLAGPLYLKGRQKSYIVLFTCAVYRAIHIELVTSLSTDAFLQALRRFISRRGRPTVIYSDNGTNFVGADNLFGGLDWKSIETYSDLQRIQWKFNPPTGAWWGGFFERMIQMVKRILRRVLGRAALSYEELATTLCDTEAVINTRPLTYLSEDTDDLMPLTPSMFLQEVKEIGVPDMDILDEQGLNKRYSYRRRLRKELRERFRQEYLGMLLQPGGKVKSTKPVAKGDIVLIGADGTKRLDWILGRVLEVFPGHDGIVRVARLKTATGELTRPIQRLYSLEVSYDDRKDILPEKIEEIREPEKVKVSRSGRVLKAPARYGF